MKLMDMAHQRLTAAHAEEDLLEGDGAAEQGFTLIELMVVLLIMGILMAIAIPTFLGATNTAKDRSAQNNLSIAVTDVQTAYTGNQQAMGTASALVGSVSSSDPEVGASTVAPTTTKGVGIAVTGTAAFIAALSGSKTCFYAVVNDSSTAVHGAGPGVHYAKGGSTCSLSLTGTTVPTTWSSTLPS